MSTYDNDHRHPDWAPDVRDCPFESCAACGPVVDAVEEACEVMHAAYEAAATVEGWETQQRSRKPWSEVPEANKATMRVAVRALLDHLGKN